MKKLFKCVCSVVLLLLLFAVITYAHSGKTDSNGGHYNHSTGEYHYHHGYSAHSHYDMDGDGKLDCPYEFDDKTNHGNSSSNNDSNSNNNTEQTRQTTAKDIVITILKIIALSMFVLLVGCSTAILPLLYWLLMTPIDALIKKHCKEDLQEKVRDKVRVIVIAFIVIAVVSLVTIAVLLARHN